MNLCYRSAFVDYLLFKIRKLSCGKRKVCIKKKIEN